MVLAHVLRLFREVRDPRPGEGCADVPSTGDGCPPACDLGSVGAVVAVVDLADQAARGAEPRHYRGALEDGIGAAAEVSGSGECRPRWPRWSGSFPRSEVVLQCRVVAWLFEEDTLLALVDGSGARELLYTDPDEADFLPLGILAGVEERL